MLQRVVLHDCHDGSHSHTVVGAERSALCSYPLTVDPCLDRIGLEVVSALEILLWHHVHVGLQNGSLAVFHTSGCRFAHHDVSGCILECLHTNTFCKLKQELLHFLQMS